MSELELLQAWIERDPSHRVVDRMARIDGNCALELRSKSGVFTSTSQVTFGGAIRNALMIAMSAGEK